MNKRFTALLLLAFALIANAKYYEFSRVEIVAQPKTDGAMRVMEKRTFDFDGEFSFAYRSFPKSDSITFSNVKISENGTAYEQAKTKSPGAFIREETKDEIRYTWYYKAEDEQRTFTIEYVVDGVIKRYADAAVLHYSFISSEWDKPTAVARIQVNTPGNIDAPSTRAWLHGPLWGELEVKSDGTLVATCENVPKNSFLDIRALYDPALFPNLPQSSDYVRQSIMASEAQAAEQANLQREEMLQKQQIQQERAATAEWLFPLAAVLGVLIWIYLYRRYGIRPQVSSAPSRRSDVPTDVHPALLDYLLYQSITGNAVVSTFLHLCRKGILNLKETREIRTRFGKDKEKPMYTWHLNREKWRQQRESLYKFENDLLDHVFNIKARRSDAITFDEMEKNKDQFLDFFNEWQNDVAQAAKEENWYDRQSYKGLYFGLGLASVFLLLGIGAAFFVGLWSLVLFGASLVLFILAAFIPHRTRQGRELLNHLKAVQRYLKKSGYEKTSETDYLEHLDDYVEYGPALRLSASKYTDMIKRVPTEQIAVILPWYILGATGTGRPTFSPDSFGNSFSSMIEATTASMSSTAGLSGGATSGAAGAGSGGGGAG